uniref:Uncharacterized protein n=1 Tax=Physcomitrium patens TaxID=3218 RepID=A0A2K1KVN1_PHYPA|nr:hypothetical protein PHYPA_004846 [Physcomitrium patens]
MVLDQNLHEELDKNQMDEARHIVLRLDQRAILICQVHKKFGHFGVRRKYSILHNQC